MEDQKNIAAGTAPDADDEIDLVELAGNFFRIDKRLWWLFVVLVAAGVGGMYAFSYFRYEPTYRCEATFTIARHNINAKCVFINFRQFRNIVSQLALIGKGKVFLH